MSGEVVICYPLSFLERPEDRLFLMELRDAGVSGGAASFLLYRIWADFATGKSNRRKVHGDLAALPADPNVRLMEDFCGWEGRPGALVGAAIASGFLVFEDTGGVRSLVCHGFFPLNSAWCRDGKSFQRRGGLSRSVDRQAVAVDREARELETLWDRNGSQFEGVDPSRRGDGVRFAMCVARAMDVPRPGEADLKSGILRRSIEIIDRASQEEVKSTLVWIVGNRNDESVPRRLDQMLRKWDEIAARAKSENS